MPRSLTFLLILAATFVMTAPAQALVTINQTSVAASGGTVTITGTSGQQGLRVAGCTNTSGTASQSGPGSASPTTAATTAPMAMAAA